MSVDFIPRNSVVKVSGVEGGCCWRGAPSESHPMDYLKLAVGAGGSLPGLSAGGVCVSVYCFIITCRVLQHLPHSCLRVATLTRGGSSEFTFSSSFLHSDREICLNLPESPIDL